MYFGSSYEKVTSIIKKVPITANIEGGPIVTGIEGVSILRVIS